MRLTGLRAAVIAVAVAFLGVSGAIGDAANPTDPAARRGSETNLPLPRFVSLRADEGNVRRGPSLGHKIDWVFKRRNMPLEVTAEYGHWRRVRDKDGAGGWMHYALLSGVRTVIVETDLLPLYRKPDPGSQVNAYAEAGVIARLGACNPTMCRITADGYSGWAEKKGLWGVRADEIRK